MRDDSAHSGDFHRGRRNPRRFSDDEPYFQKRSRHRVAMPSVETFDITDGLPEGDRWSTWDQPAAGERGPQPYPPWLVTELAAVDTELGILKTGKEADVFLLRRGVPQTGPSCLLAAKRYRDAGHRMFHRDSGYLEGRRVRESRASRAMAGRTAFGRQAIAGQWAIAEFMALVRLHEGGVPVPYPVQVTGTELLLEFIGDPDGTAAPRLAETRPGPAELRPLWDQLVGAVVLLARTRAGPWRPIRLQPPGARRPAGPDRPAAGRRRDRQPAGRDVPGTGRAQRGQLVHRPRPGGRGPGPAACRRCCATRPAWISRWRVPDARHPHRAGPAVSARRI